MILFYFCFCFVIVVTYFPFWSDYLSLYCTILFFIFFIFIIWSVVAISRVWAIRDTVIIWCFAIGAVCYIIFTCVLLFVVVYSSSVIVDDSWWSIVLFIIVEGFLKFVALLLSICFRSYLNSSVQVLDYLR